MMTTLRLVTGVGLLAGISCAMAADGAAAPAAKPAERPAVLQGVKRILFYGDSLTDGSDYPDYVVNTLNTLFPQAGFEIMNSAICGNTAAQLRARLQADVLARKPDLVSICIGTNDCLGKRPVADYEADMEALVSDLERAGIKVLLVAPSPLGNPEREQRFQGFVAAIRNVAAKHKLLVADAHAEFVKGAKDGREMLGADGVHHGKDGFAGMARAIVDAFGFKDTPLVTEMKPWPDLLTAWETSAPVPNKPPFDPAQASGWKPYDRLTAATQQPWWDAPFAARGGWMPFALEKAPANSVAYGRTFYTSAKGGAADLRVGGAPPLWVWLNGVKVWQDRGAHGYHPNADTVAITLKPGKNEIVVISNYMAFVGVREAAAGP